MANIFDLSYFDLKNFYMINKINNMIDFNDSNVYFGALKYIKNPNYKKTIPIVEWMMAYNLLKNKTNIKTYNVNDIRQLSDVERNSLAKTMKMKSDNTDHILNILRYMHKLTDYLMIGKSIIISISADIYNIFPKEIWIKILMDLHCKDIDELSSKSNQFKQLSEEQNIKEQIKIKGFPRVEGHCKSHDLSSIIDDEYKDLLEDDMEDLNPIKRDILDKLLDKMCNFNFDLIKGDLIAISGFDDYRNDGIYIFDGCQIIGLDYKIDDYGSLPNEFTVINNGVPVNYWYDIGNEEYTKGISHNNIVYFDHSSVKDQCLANISDSDGHLKTHFKYDDKVYTIVALTEYDSDQSIFRSKFVRAIENNDKLIFNTEVCEISNNNILELASYFYD